MSRLIQTRNIKINRMTVDTKGNLTNRIILTADNEKYVNTLASESELHRILLHLTKGDDQNRVKSGKYNVVPGLFTLDCDVNDKKYYQKLIDCDGKLILQTDDGEEEYISTFCGAGHSRQKKNLFVRADLLDKLRDILLCGIPKNLVYTKPHKWNAYFAMCTTDSTRVSYIPNIVVIPDYEKTLFNEHVDLVGSRREKSRKFYFVESDAIHDIAIKPFDGAGIVTPECASKWAEELNCRSKKGKEYLPSCFQIRMLPAFKGELFVFDLLEFSKEYGVRKIKDIGGREWDIIDDKIDVIITQSQFKFWNLYGNDDIKYSHDLWKSAFIEKTHGYERTMNIVSYGVHPEDLREQTMLSYQPLQTLDFKEDEIKSLGQKSVSKYKDIVTDLDKFLRYRQLMTTNDAGEEEYNFNEYTPPYYIALINNRELANDPYIRNKMKTDVQRLRNNLLSGKQFVHGHYEVFVPDLFGLAEFAFGLEPKGLLAEPFQIYSSYWNQREVSRVDIIRNPHVAMEHRLCTLVNNDDTKKWYKYQTTGIISGMYDTLALALGSADYDGDTVLTTDDEAILSAVQRATDNGCARLVYCPGSGEKVKEEPISITDTKALMKINVLSFEGNIGKVINRVTDLWSLVNTDGRVRDYIKIGTIVGQETIDFAKTGEAAKFPSEINTFLKGKKRGYWMQYLQKNIADAIKAKKAVEYARKFGKSEKDIQKLNYGEDYKCTMNALCHFAEKEMEIIDTDDVKNEDSSVYKVLLKSTPPINRTVREKVLELQSQYAAMSKMHKVNAGQDKKKIQDAMNWYRCFYDSCRYELLYLEKDVQKLLDMLILLYYTDRNLMTKEKDILWNAFGDELIARCTGEDSEAVDLKDVIQRHQKNVSYKKEQKKKSASKKKVSIKYIDSDDEMTDLEVIITKEERKHIKKSIEHSNTPIGRKDNIVKYQRVMTVLLYISRKCHGIAMVWYNSDRGLNLYTMEKLTNVDHRSVETALTWLEKSGMIKAEVTKNGIKVQPAMDALSGDSWILEADYNKAATKIRDYFRYQIS